MKENMQVRIREKFDFGWRFKKGDIDIPINTKAGLIGGYTDCEDPLRIDHVFMSVIGKKPIDEEIIKNEWTEVDLPHDWCIEENYSKDVPLQAVSAYLPVGIGCYRKVFEIPACDEGKKISLEFDGIYRNSKIWVNGNYMRQHSSGHTSFELDITDVARYGEEGRNAVFIKVDATECEGWWYEGCGIYRHVWLVKTDRLHVAQWGTYITTPSITEKSAEVRICTNVLNEYNVDKECELVTTIVDAEGKKVAANSSTRTIKAYDETEFEQIITVDSPELWSVDNPYLYKVLTEVKNNGVVLDTYETPFGIRTIEFTSDKGFFLNGKHTPIKGTCNRPDFAGLGVALPDRVIEYKMQLLKEMGCNAHRTICNAPAPELLDVCDRLGILVMCENRNFSVSPNGISDLESMLYRDRNHPCVILWSMNTEEPLEGSTIGARMLRRMADLTRKIDPTRAVTAAMFQNQENTCYTDYLDVVGYNYGHEKAIRDHGRFPNRKSVGTETTSFMGARGIYEMNEMKGYLTAYGVVNANGFNLPEEAWKPVIEHPYLTGIFAWTGFDYRGECMAFKWPSVLNTTGAMDNCGFRNDNYYYYKSAWTDEPTVHIFPHWNWVGMEGREIEVWSFSNCDTVELLLNGESLGEKEMVPLSHLTWNIKYIPGELKAIARKNGIITATKTVETTNSPAKISLDPDRSVIKADGCDVSIIRVAVLDDKGRVVPAADDEILFSLEGPGKILCLSNGDPSSHESEKPGLSRRFCSDGKFGDMKIIGQVRNGILPDPDPNKNGVRRAFNGYCLVVIQSQKQPGIMKLKAYFSNRIGESIVEIKAE